MEANRSCRDGADNNQCGRSNQNLSIGWNEQLRPVSPGDEDERGEDACVWLGVEKGVRLSCLSPRSLARIAGFPASKNPG